MTGPQQPPPPPQWQPGAPPGQAPFPAQAGGYGGPPDGYPPPGPGGYPPPGGGYPPVGAPFGPPPPKKRSAAPWIVGGAVLVVIVLVLICGLGIFVVRKQAQNQRAARASADPTSFTGNTRGAKGKYDAAKVSNLCDKIDAKPVRDALPTATEQRPAEHRESRNDYFSSLSCSLSGRAPATARDYSSYSLNVSATYSDTEQSAERVFNSSKEYAAGRTGTGHTYGTISDLGKDAYFESESGSSYNSCTIVLYDSNVSLRIDVGASGKATTAEQLKALLTGVAKTSVANLR